jgi:hypothetical protein
MKSSSAVIFACMALAGIASGCASISSVSLTSIPARRAGEISAQASRLIILGLNFNNDYVNDVATGLQEKCPGGQIRGILTKDETIDYFLFLVYRRRVTATGYCLRAATALNEPGPRQVAP